MVNPNRFYTYAYLREDKTPYYIGKGYGNRLYKRNRGDIKPPKDKSKIIFLKKNLTEEDAFKHEIYMIAVFGRKDLGTGILRNLTDGGDNPPSWEGKKHTEETKRKIKEANKGRKHTEETKRKISEANKGKSSPNGFRGKKHTEETKQKISENNKGEKNYMYGKTHTKETRRKLSEVNKGKPKPKIREALLGKKLTEETKRKMSEVRKGKKHTEETKRKMSENRKGRKHTEETKQKIKETKRKIREANK